MELLYNSTRNKDEKVTASLAILKGLAPDGGLYVPAYIPKLEKGMDAFANMSYQETKLEVTKFFTDFTEEELKSCIAKATMINLTQSHCSSKKDQRCLLSGTVSWSYHCI